MSGNSVILWLILVLVVHQIALDVGTRMVLYNSWKVLMIIKYWITIGYINICSSVQDHRIYLSSIEQVWKHQKLKRTPKFLVEDLKKSQSEVNTLDENTRISTFKFVTPIISSFRTNCNRPFFVTIILLFILCV